MEAPAVNPRSALRGWSGRGCLAPGAAEVAAGAAAAVAAVAVVVVAAAGNLLE